MPEAPLIDFTWLRDRGGYVLLPARSPRKPANADADWILQVKATEIQPERIVGKGGDLEERKIIKNFPGLYRTFAKITSPIDLLKFVEKFGALTRAGFAGGNGDVVPTLLDSARAMATQLDKFGRQSEPFVLPSMNLKLFVTNRKNGARLVFSPATLLDALWLQWALELSGGGKLMQCLYCANLFRAGPGFGRRSDSLFCCDDHRVEFNSFKRSKG